MEESRVVLGKRIRKLRRKAGLTQGELAEKAKVSPKHLGEIERGRGNPYLSNIESLAHALDTPLAAIFDHEHEKLSIDEMKVRINQLIDTASEEECRLAYRIFKAIFNS